MKRGIKFENGKVIDYSGNLAKVVLDQKQVKAIELLIKKHISDVQVIPTGSGGYRTITRTCNSKHPSSDGH